MTDPQIDFTRWLHRRIDDQTKPPLVVTINLAECDCKIPPLLATSTDGMRAIKAHNERIGVFS